MPAPRFSKSVSLFVSLFTLALAGAANATVATELAPASAPHGARVIVVGAGLDATGLSLAFTASGNASAAADIVSRTPQVIEAVVPANAVSGTVTLASGTSSIATFSFTLAADPAFTQVSTLAGRPSGDSSFKNPLAIVAIPGGFLVADSGDNQIRKVTSAGVVTVYAGSGQSGYADGTASTALFQAPAGIAFDGTRSIVYVADTGNHRIRAIAADGTVSTLVGSVQNSLTTPNGIALDAAGDVYIADQGKNAILIVTSAGALTTLAGGTGNGLTNGPASSARFSQPKAVAVTSSGIVYVADTGNNVIRKIDLPDSSGVRQVSTVGASGLFSQPAGIAIDAAGNLVVADTGNNRIRSMNLTTTPVTVTTLAGSTTNGFVDGAPLTAAFHQPTGLAVTGAIYVADANNNAIRVLNLAVTTTDLWPRRGPLAGSNVVRIFGTGFSSGVTDVKFGAVSATNIIVIADTELTATVPAATAGAVDVSITTPGGTTTLAGAYTYIPPPGLTSVAPNKGALAGGTTVSISGANFIAGDTSVTIGGAPATIVSTTASTITVTVPAAPAGAADLVVQTPGGTATLTGAFVYLSPPAITAFTPTTGHTGTNVTITGTGFDADAGATQVKFGSIGATIVSITSTEIVASVPASAVSAVISITTGGGTATSGSNFIVGDITSITIAPASASIPSGLTQTFTAAAVYADGSTQDITTSVVWASSNTAVATIGASGIARGLSEGDATISASMASLVATANLHVGAAEALPPDPATIAPPIDPTKVTTIDESTRFLYTGTNPIQRGMVDGTIERQRAAVVRGRALTRDNAVLGGVSVTIVGHHEFGSTLTRADGYFDLVVNGGGSLTIRYEKNGFISLDRAVEVPWNDFKQIDDVVLIPYDANVSSIVAGAAISQVARGGVVTDENGSRQATLIFAPGTNATMTLTAGGTQALSSLSIRATEFTIGANGALAMPAALPPSTGYTYCVELSADEAVAAGASSVILSKPAAFYLEDYREFPVGSVVPLGYYDRDCGSWIPSDNGRVVSVVAITAGRAYLDIDGDGQADDSDALLGTTVGERDKLASLYSVGQKLLRMPIPHFSSWDGNLPPSPPEDAVAPTGAAPQAESTETCSATRPNQSVIECEAQTLMESVPVTGTGMRLNYSSARVPGRTSSRSLHIPISGDFVPPSLLRIELTIDIAGQRIRQVFPPEPNQNYDFTWDQLDAYGRPNQGTAPFQVTIAFDYPRTWVLASTYNKALLATGIPGVSIGNIDVIDGIPIGRAWNVEIDKAGTWDARGAGLGGWTLDLQHFYDHSSGTMYTGEGSRRRTRSGTSTIRSLTVGGSAVTGNTRGRVSALALTGTGPSSVTRDSQGNIYVSSGAFVYRVAPDGSQTIVAGSGSTDFNGDGLAATSAGLQPGALAISADGRLFIADEINRRVRMVVNGIITTVAGNGDPGFTTDEVPQATSAPVTPHGVALSSQNILYITDRENNVLRALTLCDGRMWSVFSPSSGGGVSSARTVAATSIGRTAKLLAPIDPPEYVALSPSGVVYFTSKGNALTKVNPNGSKQVLQGSTNVCAGYFCGPARAGGLAFIGETLYNADPSHNQVRAFIADAPPIVVAGQGAVGFSGDGGYADAALLSGPTDVTATPDGKLYVSDVGNNRIRVIESPFPKTLLGETAVASPSGSEFYVFDRDGRHLRTIDSLLGITRYQFGYDGGGYLTSITDVDGNITRIERSNKTPTAIIAAGGQRTSLAVDVNGYLASVSNPAGESHQFAYLAGDGLMSQMTDPRSNHGTYTYDTEGRLIVDSDDIGGSITLSRQGTDSNYHVSTASAEGRIADYSVEKHTDGSEVRVHTDEAGLQTVTTTSAAGVSQTHLADGTSQIVRSAGDPRFGLQAALGSDTSTQIPGIATLTRGESRSYTMGPDGQSVASATTSLTVNGHVFASLFDGTSRTTTLSSPAGRQATIQYDGKGHVSSSAVPGLAPTLYEYDTTGLLTSVTQSDRHFTLSYDQNRRLASVTDPQSHTVHLNYDTSDRMIRQTLPDTRVIGFTYDANGNLLGITPPGRADHRFTYSAVNQTTSYAPPVSTATQYTYDRDRALTLVRRGDGSTALPSYDGAGRVQALTIGRGSYQYAYDSAGRLASIVAPDGGTTTLTTSASTVTAVTWTGAVTGTLNWTYDNDMHVVSETVSCAAQPCIPLTFDYDADGLLTRAGSMTLMRDAHNGLLLGTTLDPVADNYSYNDHGDLLSYQVAIGGTPVFGESLTRDNLGRITQNTENIDGNTTAFQYGYDVSGRLMSVSKNGATVASYNYDANGNRLSRATPERTDVGAYDGEDRLVTYNQASYSYDGAGELISVTDAVGPTNYTYDELGNLLHVHLSSGAEIDFVVDGQNRRIGKKVNGTFVYRFLYSDPLRIAAAVDESGNETTRFVYSTHTNVPDVMVRSGIAYRIVTDHLGSVRMVIDTTTGAIVQRIDYDEFGNILSDSSPGFQPFGFAGGVHDSDTTLVRFGDRDYDPRTGRWTTKDPILFDGGDTNVYGYVMNNPTNLTDPAGLTWTTNWNFFWDWVLGDGAAKRNYGPNSVESQEMKQSPGAAEMRKTFYAGHCKSANRLAYGTVQAYMDTTADPRTLDWSSTAAQVGGFGGASVANNGNGTATFTIPNVAGTHSFFLHAVPDRKSPTGAMSNINQTFTWTEPISGGSCGCQ